MYANQIENTCVMQASLEVRVTIDVLLQILIDISPEMIQLGNKLLISDSISSERWRVREEKEIVEIPRQGSIKIKQAQ